MMLKATLDTLLIGMTPGLGGFIGLHPVKQGCIITQLSAQNKMIIQVFRGL